MAKNLSIDLRPRRFEDVVGSKNIVESIKNRLATGKIPAAFLFCGQSGTGKTTMSHIIARYIQGPDFVGELDMQEQNAGVHSGVDNARELVSQASYRPRNGKYGVIIINEAQKLTDAAQQAWLDYLELEESSTIVFFTSMDPSKINDALAGRCARFNLRGLPWPEIVYLVKQTMKAANCSRDVEPLLNALESVNISAPRAIVQAVEQYSNGMSPDEAVSVSENEPLYADIAKAVLSGNWTRVQEQLKTVKSADGKALRAVISAFIKGALLNDTPCPRFDVFADLALKLALYQSYDDSTAFASMTAALYQAGKKLKELK